MTKVIISLFLLSPIILVAQTKVEYKVHYAQNMEMEGLKVEFTHKTKKAQDSLYVHFYDSGWGEYDLFNCLEIMQEENPGYSFDFVPDSNRIIIRYPKSKTVTFKYRIRQDYPGDSVHITNRPRMNNAYFHVLGRSLFVVPESVFLSKDRTLEAKIDWVGFPASYKIHNTFESDVQTQRIKAEINSGFYHSLFVGGDYRLHTFDINKKPVVFAIRGEWFADYKDDMRMVASLKKTIQTQRDFWRDHNQSYYTVIMTPTVSQNDSLFQGQSSVGSGLHNAFMIQSTNNPFNNFSVLNYLFNHEMMHQWIGLSIRPAHEELNYWFTEGFTDYYSYKNRLSEGDLSLEEWCKAINEEVIQSHYENPQRNRPNYVIMDDFWKSRDVEKIPYRRGAIFAFWLDNKIMKASNYAQSLDDLMRKLLEKCKRESLRLSDELFLTEAKEFLSGEDISYEFQKFVLNGEDLPLTSEDVIDCFRVEFVNDIPQIVLQPSPHQYLMK